MLITRDAYVISRLSHATTKVVGVVNTTKRYELIDYSKSWHSYFFLNASAVSIVGTTVETNFFQEHLGD